MAEHLPRKLAVIVHADVVGSTALVQKNEALAHERIQESFRRLSKTIESYGGTAHEIRGDALVAEFGRVSDAVCAAVAFQRKNSDFNTTLEDDIQPSLRLGIAMGEVVISDNTITGEGVVLAQRLEQIAEPGGVCIQGAAYETVPKRLPFDYETLGEHTLKGFEEPVRAYGITLKDGEAVPVPELASQSGKQALELPDKPSIAVLPFTNMSGDLEQDYFCDGITEDITTALSRISDIFVIARNSSFVYKNKPKRVADVASDLGVRYILEGSVRKAGNRVRITSQLIDAITEHHLWAESYDRDLDDIFAIQDEITHEVIVALQVKLATGDVARQWAAGTQNREAWEHMISGREHYYGFTSESIAEARHQFERALEIDPDYGTAIMWLGWTYWYDARFGYTRNTQSSLELAERQVAKLKSSEHGQSIVGTLQGSIHLIKGEHEEAVRAARLAVEFPHGPGDRVHLGIILMYAGQPAEAIKEIGSAIRLNPHHPSWFLYPLALAYLWHGEMERAIKVGNVYLGRAPDDPFAYASLAVIFAMAGRNEEAKQTVTNLLTISPTFRVKDYARAQHYKDPKPLEQVIQALREAGLPE